MTQNCPNWPKKDQKLPKWPKNEPKWPICRICRFLHLWTNADHCSNDNNRQKEASPKILAKIDFIYLDDQALIRSFKIYMYKDQ